MNKRPSLKQFISRSRFHYVRRVFSLRIVKANYTGTQMQDFLSRPNYWFRHKAIRVIKGDKRHRSEIRVCTIDQRDYAVKRYNFKNPFRAIKILLLGSRGLNAWYYHVLCDELGIPVPKPIAFVEQCFGPLHGKAYIVSEFVEGTQGDQQVRNAKEWEKITPLLIDLFTTLHAAMLIHGDFQLANFIFTDEQFYVCDFDDMYEFNGSELDYINAHLDEIKHLARYTDKGSATQKMLQGLSVTYADMLSKGE